MFVIPPERRYVCNACHVTRTLHRSATVFRCRPTGPARYPLAHDSVDTRCRPNRVGGCSGGVAGSHCDRCQGDWRLRLQRDSRRQPRLSHRTMSEHRGRVQEHLRSRSSRGDHGFAAPASGQPTERGRARGLGLSALRKHRARRRSHAETASQKLTFTPNWTCLGS